jgi:hypothetical protein
LENDSGGLSARRGEQSDGAKKMDRTGVAQIIGQNVLKLLHRDNLRGLTVRRPQKRKVPAISLSWTDWEGGAGPLHMTGFFDSTSSKRDFFSCPFEWRRVMA